jgi:DNA invertase Pin-like site-specific DNA recombinase
MDRTSTASLGQGITQLRCTVYARTSSRETQGAAYTSIDAQLDAGLAYIRSRAGIGWEFMGVTYSDAEISGAVLERPGLHRLMRDIESGKVNVVVTIKLDRISRRVKDFAQMMAFSSAMV